MRKVVIIGKTGSCSMENAKNITLDSLYKKCKFRKPDDFSKRATWQDGDNWVSVYARDTGRAGGENKYDLPPPVDKELYFGPMMVIRHSSESPSDENLIDISDKEWKKIYEKCMGGFEDLGAEDSEEEDEEEIPVHLQTAQGYMKDGFVVSDGEPEEEGGEEVIPDEEEEDEDDEDAEDVEYGGGTGDEGDSNVSADCEEGGDESEEETETETETEEGSELSEDEYEYK